MAHQLTVTWPDIPNEHGRPMLWLATWLTGDDGQEGDWFHSGRGPATTHHPVPPHATGIRVRRWPAEGLAPQYADCVPVPAGTVDVQTLPFERRQPFSRLVVGALDGLSSLDGPEPVDSPHPVDT